MKLVSLDRDTLSPHTCLRPPAFSHVLVCHARTSPDEVAARIADADIVLEHCPLLPATRHMTGPAEFAAMRRRPLLVNTARGGLVDASAVGPADNVEAFERGAPVNLFGA